MANKGGYPGYPTQPTGYPQQPPPPYQYQPQPQTQNTVIIHQQQPVVVGKSSRGLLGQLGHELNVLGNTVSREVNWATKQVNDGLATSATGTILGQFTTGNVIQLIASSNGGCLQIVQNAQGQLVLDGRGQQGAPNATWTVINEGNNQVRLHNNNNYLSIMNGNTILISMPQGMPVQGVETKFQVVNIGTFVYLESMKERGRHIGILPSGDLKSALATGRDLHAKFGVRLLYSAYPQATVTTVTTKR